jgi:zinc/manganese transport system substrate-binding protein
MLLIKRALLAALSLGVVLGGETRAGDPVKVVASFSILADFVREVGGNRVQVTSLVPPNGDVHVFEPSPADAARLAGADVIIVNGLGLEGWVDRLVKASGTKAAAVVASKGAQTIQGEGHPTPTPGGAGQGSHAQDPHAWQRVANAKVYAANIRDALIAADPGGRETYEANTARYVAGLDELEREVKEALAAIPAERRKVITTHDAFGYFGRAYGIAFIAPRGVSTEAEATARDVARIVRQIRAEKVPAVFLENVSDPRLMQRIAQESGARIGGKVFSDALSDPAGPAGTYVAMIRNNVRAFVEALSQ